MTRVRGARLRARRWLVAGLVVGTTLACAQSAQIPQVDVGAAPATRMLVAARPDPRPALLAEAATNYDYGVERQPLPVEPHVVTGPGGTIPNITIATATRRSAVGRRALSRVAARFTSTGAYAPLGVAPGVNYVWAEGTVTGADTTWRFLVVPNNVTYPMVWLKVTDTSALHSSPTTEPRLVKSSTAYGYCDPDCDLMHCVSDSSVGNYSTTTDSVRILDR